MTPAVQVTSWPEAAIQECLLSRGCWGLRRTEVRILATFNGPRATFRSLCYTRVSRFGHSVAVEARRAPEAEALPQDFSPQGSW
jgi:hypothetical protein